jgi:soluble lytic murein transglycosylase-like protein
MRLEDLAVRLLAVEAKLALLTGAEVTAEDATSVEELDARLSVVEVTVDQLIAEKTQSHIKTIVAAPANDVTVTVEEIVALSPSASDFVATEIVADVVTAQQESAAIENTQVAEIVAAAVAAVVMADPTVVADPVAITAAITEAVADLPAPAPEVVAEAAAAVAEIVAAATGDEVTAEVQQSIVDAVAYDPMLDYIEQRLNVVETKIDSLLGK